MNIETKTVKVKQLDGNNTEIELNLNDNGLEVQRKIAERLNRPFEQIKMIHEGVLITSFKHFFTEFGKWYQDNKPICIVLRLGGPDPITSALFSYLDLPEELREIFDIDKMVNYYSEHIEESSECSICSEYRINRFSNCNHWACGECWMKMYDQGKNEIKCPACREKVLAIL